MTQEEFQILESRIEQAVSTFDISKHRHLERADLVQESWVIAIEALREWNGWGQLGGWIYTKVRWGLVDFLRQKGVDLRRGTQAPIVSAGGMLNGLPGDQDLDEELHWKLVLDEVGDSVYRQPPRNREIIEQRIGGEKMAQIGKQHEITEARVSQILKKFKNDHAALAA